MLAWTALFLIGLFVATRPLVRLEWMQMPLFFPLLILFFFLTLFFSGALILFYPLTSYLKKIFIIFLTLLFGFSWGLLSIHVYYTHQFPITFEGKTLLADGVIASIPQNKSRSVRFLFKIKQLRAGDKPLSISMPLKVQLSWYGNFSRLKVGDRWILSVRLKRPHGFNNPGGFDYERWLMERGINATGYVYGRGENRLVDSSYWSRPIDRIRQFLADRIRSILRNKAMSGLIVALCVGERSGISQDQWQVFRATGTSHLMAISGLHIGLAAGFFYLLINFLWRRLSRAALWFAAPRAAAVAGMIGALLYSALAGFSLPTERALIMITVFMGATLLRRELSPFNALSIALLIILSLHPLAVSSAGFLLSFGAVVIIIYGMSSRLKVSSLWWRVGRVQWVVTMGLMPLTLLLFHQLSLGALGANLIAIPWVSFLVVPFSLIGALIVPISGNIAVIFLKLSAISLNMLWFFLAWLAHLPHFVWSHTLSNPLIFIASLIGVLLLIAPRGLPARSLGIFWLLPLLMLKPPRPVKGELWLTLLDVGQGLSAVIETHQHTLVYDTGPRFSETFNAGDAVLIPFLRYRGVTRVDKLIVSHGDSDHIGGAKPLLQAIPTDEIFTSVPNRFPNRNVKLCKAGEHWKWDGVTFKMLFPVKRFMDEDNNKSCVLAVRVGAKQILLTGDIEAPAEDYLVKHDRAQLKSTILIAPHHGSITSSTPAFVKAVTPQYVLFPVGYRNRFHFPNPLVVNRYKSLQARILRSDQDGAITFKIGPSSSDISTCIEP